MGGTTPSKLPLWWVVPGGSLENHAGRIGGAYNVALTSLCHRRPHWTSLGRCYPSPRNSGSLFVSWDWCRRRPMPSPQSSCWLGQSSWRKKRGALSRCLDVMTEARVAKHSSHIKMSVTSPRWGPPFWFGNCVFISSTHHESRSSSNMSTKFLFKILTNLWGTAVVPGRSIVMSVLVGKIDRPGKLCWLP